MHYQYMCFECRKKFCAEVIENNFHYLCPECGSAEKNSPLRGVLSIEYDYNSISKKTGRDDFLKNEPGCMWNYPYLWPLKSPGNGSSILKNIENILLERLKLFNAPILKFKNENHTVNVFDDTRNPTFSYKDRASILVVLKAMQLGIKKITTASTGNAGSSLAGICARLGLESHIFVPVNIPTAKRLQIQAYGAHLYIIDGDYDQAFDLNLEITQKKGWYNRNTAYNPLTIEGKKSAAFDIFIAGKGTIPDVIFVPVGDGVIISGIFKGFSDLLKLGWIDKIPRLIGVQAAGSDALVRFINTGKFSYLPAKTIADSIHAGAPRNLYMAAHAVKKSAGDAISVSDEEIIRAQKTAARELGLLIEPAAAASYAGFQLYASLGKIREKDSVLLMFTGNGLKDAVSLEQWNPVPKAKSPQEWKEYLK